MTNDKAVMPNQNKNPNDKKYDLEERTGKFGLDIINFSKKIPQNPITKPLISQIVRSATSIGANYCEADGAESRKEFIHRIGLCKREAKETKHWLRMLSGTGAGLEAEIQKYSKEAQELVLIFAAITRSARSN